MRCVTLIYVHGGVSGTPKPAPSLRAAFRGDPVSALDAVESAIRALEDHPELNAGYGAVLDLDGELSLDAGIADGSTGKIGAVANVRVKNPISLARKVMEQTPHVLLTGAGAHDFGAGMERLEATTPERIADYERAKANGELGREHFGNPEQVDTVGAVALDDAGRLAAGSSTGGVFGKMPGRVGDAPIFGAGFYASTTAAVVGTGVGELFLETLATFRTGLLIETGVNPQAACERTIELIGKRSSGAAAGLLAIARNGSVGAAFRGGMLAVEGPDGPYAAVRLD